jgi:hypothetical protein
MTLFKQGKKSYITKEKLGKSTLYSIFDEKNDFESEKDFFSLEHKNAQKKALDYFEEKERE